MNRNNYLHIKNNIYWKEVAYVTLFVLEVPYISKQLKYGQDFENENGLLSYRCGYIMEISTEYNLRVFANCFTLTPLCPQLESALWMAFFKNKTSKDFAFFSRFEKPLCYILTIFGKQVLKDLDGPKFLPQRWLL